MSTRSLKRRTHMAVDNALELRGQTLYDQSGDKIGRVEEIYLDQETDRPEWALVNTGLFGTKSTFVPLADATSEGDGVRVPYEKSMIKDAPGIDAEGELSQQEEEQLYSFYGLSYGEQRSDSGLPEGGGDAATTEHRDQSDRSADPTPMGAGSGNDVSGPETDEAMTRSEEEVRIGTVRREAGRARLRKHIVTEQVTQTVPVQREEVRVEREPITDANVGQATSGADLSEEVHEVDLQREEVVVDKTVVPKERVRLDKDVVTEQRQVSEEVRKEQIDVEGVETSGGDVDVDRDRGV